ncbi:hypothetical protein PMAYCL1PPCAC_33208 [Pristionchus mayeri]|uniref:Protein kinase n=1 Tax=Pristionchus mayeri TaxID=1317129 RepID=A0AAN5IE39_9BILA|nr:hypothetical protein PMAYCL1PPCAC_33208 [Pristionchus mayeri]
MEENVPIRDADGSIFTFPSVEILRQMTSGLAHLHSKKIVHRDLKPQNVLFSVRGGTVRAVISDFGLCKTHRPDMMSLSKGSGVVGTFGWVAPEVLKGQSTSYPMDIFSLGCIFYYVLTGGSHPFGEPVHQTSKIDKGIYKLRGLGIESRGLIELTLSSFPASRPTASAILIHPLFMTMKEQLDFFCIVSDRLDVENNASKLRGRLENNSSAVINLNWRNKISDKLMKELDVMRKYRPN